MIFTCCACVCASLCVALAGTAAASTSSACCGEFAGNPRSLQQTVSEMTTMPPVPDFTATIPMLYNATAFIKTGTSNGPSPVPSCCPSLMSEVATAGRRLKQASVTDGCPTGTSLKGSSQTGHWGYWYDLLQPALVIGNDTEIEVEMPTFEAGLARSEMGKGDPGMEDIYHWDPVTGPRIAFKGPTGTSGGHYMTGPIYVCGAEPGDVLEVQILDLLPRPNPQNESFGATTAYSIGWWNRTGYTTPGYAPSRAATVIYKAIKDPATGRPQYWEPQYLFDSSSPLLNKTTSGCVPTEGPLPRTTPNGAGYYNNSDRMYGTPVPCLNNTQNFTGTGYSGLVYDAPEQLRDYSVKGKWRIPVNMHIGNMGLAPAVGAPLITAPPMRTGGNIGNKRIGIGATMYYPVEAVGALLSMGDCHGSQGDGESVATGVETSLNGKFRIILHKADSLPKKLQLINYPIIENVNEIIIQGYAYQDWVREIPHPQVNVNAVGPTGGVDLNRAMSTIYNETRAFLIHNYNITEDMAINIMSLGVDFEITQVVDYNVGIHAKIPKWLFNSTLWETEPFYEASVKTGTSRTSYP